ncbi:MAG: LysM peptidoglycan-binding domain-containing protein [Lentisphaeria bacterium]
MTKQNTSVMPVVRAVAFVLLLTIVMGCSSFQRPQLAERPRNATENQWAQVVEEWYPEWDSPIHPAPTRDNGTTIATVRAPEPQPIEHHAVTPVPVVTPAEPVATQEDLTPAGPPIDKMPGRLPQLIRNPNEAPAARQTFHLVPAEEGGSDVATARIYRVRKGDTLSAIARRFYGTSTAAQTIFDANRDVLSNLNHVRSGMILKLP